MHRFDEMTEPELKEFFVELAGEIKARLPPETGFIILCTPFDGKKVSITQYAKNVSHEVAKDFMIDVLARWVRNEEIER